MAAPEIPPGIYPVFLTMTTQEMFKVVSGHHVTEECPYKRVNIAAILKDVNFRGVISDWQARYIVRPLLHNSTQQHTAPHRTTPQHTATYRNTPQHTATHRDTPRHTAIHSNALQHTATLIQPLTVESITMGSLPRRNSKSTYRSCPRRRAMTLKRRRISCA